MGAPVAIIGAILFVAGLAAVVGLSCAPGGALLGWWLQRQQFADMWVRRLFLRTRPVVIAALPPVAAIALGIGAFMYDARLWVAAGAAWLCPDIVFRIVQRRRGKAIEEQLPGWLSLLSNMMRVTGSLLDAITQTAAMVGGPLGQEIDLLLKETRVGSPLPEALRHMARRVHSGMFHTAATVMLVGRETGGDLPHLLEETASAFRERLRLEGVIRKQTAAGRSQLFVLIAAPPVLAYLLHEFDPDFFNPLVALGFLGQLFIGVVVTLWIVSIMMARRILNVDI